MMIIFHTQEGEESNLGICSIRLYSVAVPLESDYISPPHRYNSINKILRQLEKRCRKLCLAWQPKADLDKWLND